MNNKYLYEIIESLEQAGMLQDIPEIITSGLSSNIKLREYQELAFQYFVTYYENEKLHKNKQIHTLFHMATGSGKTVIMAGLILYLYTKGYRKFLFFVNQSNVVEKTKDNFTNSSATKYLFAKNVSYAGNKIRINMVDNFTNDETNEDIQICFTTTQKLHIDLNIPKENSLSYHDFEDNKIVFISDESHHVNSSTKKESKEEAEERRSWEYSVTNALSQNKDSIMLEFTATADLKDKNVAQKYKDKIIFDYQLKKFRESGYTKDFKNFATESDLWTRALMAIVISEYRKYLFNDNKLNIKPVVMFKSQKKDASKEFYDTFFDKLEALTSYELINLYKSNIEVLNKALDYFKNKDNTFELLEHSLKDSFTKDKTIIINCETDNNKNKQLLLNSLEDEDNNIRLIFTVDMLNEGWDVLNLYDIVRLYDTRQGSGTAGKIGSYTIKEAQLIGRGARYCPFKITEEQDKYKRKYDSDLDNELRVLETMYFHSKNDSKYIAELRQALIESGLQDKEPIEKTYIVKDSFKDSSFYKKAFIYANKRIPKNRKDVIALEDNLKNKTYRYSVNTNKGNVVSLMDDESIGSSTSEILTIKFKDIDYNILSGASERFNELRFSVIKSKYPNVKSLKEFLTSENYLGNSTLEIKYDENVTGIELRNACIKAFSEISKHIISLKQEYEGTKQFEPIQLSSIIKNKTIHLSKIDENGGKGDSQNNCRNEAYRLDLTNEEWYIYNDNYGTSEEKLFVKYFKTDIEPKLREKGLEYYIIRNERIPELAIYSFNSGDRFEPDFLLLIKNEKEHETKFQQIYIEPKGTNLLDNDSWKEEFMIQLEENAYTNDMFDYENKYQIIGLPFFNDEFRRKEFSEAVDKLIDII